MAIEAFIPLLDAKQTVEKKVKEKPREEDLVTIESPGRPMPAIKLESPRKKRRRKTEKAEDKNVKIRRAKKDSVLVITEKPQAANKIAFALGIARKYSENNVPFYEVKKNGEKIIVASAVGHLFNLTYEKGQKGYPIFKTTWVPSYSNSKSAAFTKKYYDVLKKLSARAKEVFIATDYDIEGEVIGWNVLRFIMKEMEKNAKRMKFSTLTKFELQKAYENPLPTIDWGQAYAGETRHQVDWLYGINLSRALMSSIKRTGSFKILSIGRVQGPAMKIIVDRDKEIESFIPVPFWQVFIRANGIDFKHIEDIFNKKELDDFKDIKEAEAETLKREEHIKPPAPFDLTSLQREAHTRHNISPSKTLQIAQSLYLDGLISYPRTSSQKIPTSIEPKKILEKLRDKYPNEVQKATRDQPIEGKKSDPAHPSIYPTGEFKQIMTEDERKIYELIARRFISAFSPDAITANKKITLTSENGKKFIANGLVMLERGWTSVYETKFKEISLPDMTGKFRVSDIKTEEKETQPPKRYTPASLITLLEKKNLGTKSTRSMIIDTLFDRGYLDGKSIQATPLGKKLIETLEKYSPIIIDENLTRSLEEKMEEIQRSKNKFREKEEKIIKNVENLITDISKDFKIHEIEIGSKLLEGTEALRNFERENNTIMTCPICKQGMLQIKYSKLTKKSFVACNRYPECKTTYSLPPNALIKKTDKTNEEGLPILIALRRGKKPWLFPFDPNWKEKQDSKKKQN